MAAVHRHAGRLLDRYPPDGQQYVLHAALAAVAGLARPSHAHKQSWALFERAKALAKRCEQQKQPFSVLQMDLDHFKSVNDRFGHQAGDKVLTHAAGLITRTIRDSDVAGRVGGEEFCVVLPDTGPEQAMSIAQRIRERINRREILVKKSQTTRVSVSIGVSSAQESGSYDFEQLQSIADARLYQAKQRGRNQVVDQDEKK